VFDLRVEMLLLAPGAGKRAAGQEAALAAVSATEQPEMKGVTLAKTPMCLP